MKINNLHNLNNIPMRIKLGCFGLVLIILFISIIFLTGFIQIFSFLLDTWLGAFLVGLIVVYYLLKKIVPKLRNNREKSSKQNNFTDAEFIEIDESEEKKN